MALVKMKDIQQNKTSSAPTTAQPAAPPQKKTSKLVPMSTIIAKQEAPAATPIKIDPMLLHPENSQVMQQANAYNAANPKEPAWNSLLDNPIAHGVDTGFKWVQKPFETISTVIADATSAGNNLLSSEKRKDLDGKTYTYTPSQSRNMLTDIKNIWNKTDEHVSSDAWATGIPNLGKMDGTSANWTDVIDFGAQSISPGKLIAGPMKLAGEGINAVKGAEKVAFKKAIDDFITKTQKPPVNEDGVSTAYASAGRQGLVQEAPKGLTRMKDIQAGRIPVEDATNQVAPIRASAPKAVVRKPLPELTDNYLKPLNAYAETIYHETSPSSALDLLPGSNRYTDTTVEAATSVASSNLVKMTDIQAKGVVNGQAPKQPRTIATAATQEDVKNYAGNQMQFRQAIGQTERTINRNTVITNLRKNLGVTIDSGRLGPGTKDVLGIYKTTPEVIRSGMAEDIQTIAHEIGHHLDKKFKLQDPQYRQELDQLMQFTGHNTGAYTQAQQLEEGIAEYVRLYLTDRASALQHAPGFTQFFESKLSAKALRGLEASTHDIDTWITQGPLNQAKGLVDFDSAKRKPPVFSWNRFYTQNVNDLHPLYFAEKALTGKIGVGKDSIHKMAILTRGLAERAKLAVTDGIYINGVKVSEGLQKIVKPLEEAGISEKDFATYLDVKHAIDLKALNKRVPFTKEHIDDIMREYDTPLMQKAQQQIIKWNNSLLEISVEAGNKSQKSVDAMQKMYPNYVPYMRQFEDDIEAGFKNGGFGASSAFANITDPIKRMSEEGSYATLINPLESMVKNAFLVMNAAAKNKVGLQLAELSKIDGAGAWVEKVPGASSPTEHIVNVFENGERQGYKIRNPDLYNAMLTLDHESSTALIRFLGGAAGFLRAGATLTPEFMVRNAARDVTEAFVKVGMHPIDFAKGLVAVLGKSDTFNNFLSDGGAMGTMMALDRESLQREAMSKVFRKSLREKTLNVVTSPKELAKMVTGITPAKKIISGLRKGAEVSELSTKVGTYQRVLRKTGSREEAAFVARDLMDFNRAGSNMRQANRVIAFLNASIQGTDSMVRAFKRDPAGYLVRAFVGLSLPAIANYYANKNLDPENRKLFENIPQWQKDSFFIVHVPGTSKFARIPKPFEVGAIFATGTERLMEALEDKDPKAFAGYGKSLLTAVTPPVLLSMYTPILEALTNHSFFKGTPVVSQSYDRYEKQDQYDPIKTSEVAKNLGKVAAAVGLGHTNAASPLIIDNTIQGYGGGLGQYAVSGLDKILNTIGIGGDTPKPAKTWDESMFARPFFASTSGGGQVRTDFYSKWDKLSAAKSSADLNEEPFTDPDYERMKSAKSYVDKALKQYKLIKNNKDMNSDEKRSRLDQLDGMINDAAAQGLGK